jgi:hypothetical protein
MKKNPPRKQNYKSILDSNIKGTFYGVCNIWQTKKSKKKNKSFIRVINKVKKKK